MTEQVAITLLMVALGIHLFLMVFPFQQFKLSKRYVRAFKTGAAEERVSIVAVWLASAVHMIFLTVERINPSSQPLRDQLQKPRVHRLPRLLAVGANSRLSRLNPENV